MIFNSEGKCGCKEQEKCNCRIKMEDYPKMHHHGYEKCEMPKKNRYDEMDSCTDRVKGFNLCRKIKEARCFKHCEPISQPCNGELFNYFTSRTNYEFSGLIVVSNTRNAPGACPMTVSVTDRTGTEEVATINPGASVPIFVEGLVSLDISCGEETTTPTSTCDGEIIFDLEYCATKACF